MSDCLSHSCPTCGDEMVVMYCETHGSFLPPSTEDAPGHPFYKCYEWWIAEHVPEAPPLSECEWSEFAAVGVEEEPIHECGPHCDWGARCKTVRGEPNQ